MIKTGILVRSLKDPSQKPTAYFLEEKKIRSIPALLLPTYEYSYATSVHKSQGSEYDHVVFLASQGSEIFGKEVLYTALTRARHQIEIEMDEEVFSKALKRSSRRLSGLDFSS
jgi:exodeoxyribonuclease V alpha subunit